LAAVRKFSNEAWLFLAKPLDFLHLCMGGDIHKINKNLILLTGPGFKFFGRQLGFFEDSHFDWNMSVLFDPWFFFEKIDHHDFPPDPL
jgi:hypothetical protein